MFHLFTCLVLFFIQMTTPHVTVVIIINNTTTGINTSEDVPPIDCTTPSVMLVSRERGREGREYHHYDKINVVPYLPPSFGVGVNVTITVFISSFLRVLVVLHVSVSINLVCVTVLVVCSVLVSVIVFVSVGMSIGVDDDEITKSPPAV